MLLHPSNTVLRFSSSSSQQLQHSPAVHLQRHEQRTAIIPAGSSTIHQPGGRASNRCGVIVQARRKAAARVDISSNGHDPDEDAKNRALAAALANITGKHGKNSIMRLGDKPQGNQEVFPSGCMNLDVALGGGWPRGRVVEIFGPESCGKTTLALHAIAEVQKAKIGNVLYIDAEHAMDATYAKRLGVVVDDMYMSQPDYGEQALDVADEALRSGAFALVVVDSVSALVPRAELDGDLGSTQVGGQARLLSQSLRRLIGSARNSNGTLMFINQLRNKVAVMYGNPETTSGGNALKYYASVRVDLRKRDFIKGTGGGVMGEDAAAGIKVRAKVVKNKIAPPMRECMFDIMFAHGIDSMGALLDGAEACGAVTRRGAYYYLGERKLGQGREKALESMRTEADLLKAVEEAARAAVNAGAYEGPAGGDGDEDLEEGAADEMESLDVDPVDG